MNIIKKNAGFTIVELMISTAVFSVVLLLCATAIINVGRTFYKGVTVNKTQDTARKISEDLTQSIQFGTGNSAGFRVAKDRIIPYGGNDVKVYSLCLGEVRYSYSLDRSLGSNTAYQLPHVLWKDHGGNSACSPLDITSASLTGGEELLGDNMRVAVLDVPELVTGSKVWSVSLTIAYGDQADLFVGGGTGDFKQCINKSSGGQFCAVSNINTNAIMRL